MMGFDTHRTLSVAISGSFRKHYEEICLAVTALENLEWVVLSPAKSRVMNPEDEFLILAMDVDRSVMTIEQNHLDSVARSDALYVIDPEGYIGSSTPVEIVWALAHNVPVFLASPTCDKMIATFCHVCENPKRLADMVFTLDTEVQKIQRLSTLPQLQSYIARVVEERGFADESSRDILLLLVEEVGELAKAVRKHSELKTDVADLEKRDVALELADILIYLIDLANAEGVDLADALVTKEELNRKRTWAAQSDSTR